MQFFFFFVPKWDETGEILGSPLRRRAVRAGCASGIDEFEFEAGLLCNNDEKNCCF